MGGEFMKEERGLQLVSLAVILYRVLNKEKSLHPPSASVGFFYFYPSHEQALLGLKIKKTGTFVPGLFPCRQEV